MVIGVIGKIGSGKSACVKYIKENYDAEVFSCDDVAKAMIDNGEIDYKIENPEEFFTNENLQERCRTVVHKKVFERIYKNISDKKSKNNFEELYFVIETALPNEQLFDMCDKVICIDNSFEKKVELLLFHRNYSIGKTTMILNSQKYYEKFYDRADYKITNNGSKEEFLDKVKEVMNEICLIRK